jgi:SAM-dependent methyltransferase
MTAPTPRDLRLSLRHADADTLPFSDENFDYVSSWNVIFHGTMGDVGRRLAEIWRVLKPGGLFQGTMLSKRDVQFGRSRANRGCDRGLVFGGHQPPLDENSPELRVVKTIFNRYNEVSDTLANRPEAYQPIFMVDDDGSFLVHDWVVGFALGIGLRAKEWGKRIRLTQHRQALVPIMVYCGGEPTFCRTCRPRKSVGGKPLHMQGSLRRLPPPAQSAIPIAPPKPAANLSVDAAPAARAGSAH